MRVLDWVHGRIFAGADLRRVFYTIRFRHWRIYPESGLPGGGVAVWLYEEQFLIVYDEQAVAQYTVDAKLDQRQLRDVKNPQLFDTHHLTSPAALGVDRCAGQLAESPLDAVGQLASPVLLSHGDLLAR